MDTPETAYSAGAVRETGLLASDPPKLPGPILALSCTSSPLRGSDTRYSVGVVWTQSSLGRGRIRGFVKSEATYLSVGYQSTSPGWSPEKGASPHGKG